MAYARGSQTARSRRAVSGSGSLMGRRGVADSSRTWVPRSLLAAFGPPLGVLARRFPRSSVPPAARTQGPPKCLARSQAGHSDEAATRLLWTLPVQAPGPSRCVLVGRGAACGCLSERPGAGTVRPYPWLPGAPPLSTPERDLPECAGKIPRAFGSQARLRCSSCVPAVRSRWVRRRTELAGPGGCCRRASRGLRAAGSASATP
jgi:hypothetical protein